METKKRIMFAGPSGIGKTTLAKWVSEEYGIPFISGSVSDLLPETKEEFHKDMLNKDPKTLYTQDFSILNLRNKLFKSKEEFVSDRSYLDSAGYFMYKQSESIPKCEVENFINLCAMCLVQQCTHLIVLDFNPVLIHQWIIEDNNKRITNTYFQSIISSVMGIALSEFGYNSHNNITRISPNTSRWDFLKDQEPLNYGAEVGEVENLYGTTKVLRISEGKLDIRKKLISNFIV